MPSRASYSVTVASSAACPQARRIFLRAPSALLCRKSLRPLMQRPGSGSWQRRCSAAPDVAAAGQLFVITAGRRDTLDAVAPLFDAIGQKTFVVSGTPKAANLVKLSGNFLIASVIESLGEAMALVGKGGVDRRQYLDILTSTLFDAPVYKTYGGLIADGTFEPAGFAAPLGQKAEDPRVPLPLASLLRDRFLTLL